MGPFKKFVTAIMVIFGLLSVHVVICHQLVSLPLPSWHWANGDKLFFEKSRLSLHVSTNMLKLSTIIYFLTLTIHHLFLEMGHIYVHVFHFHNQMMHCNVFILMAKWHM